jgi:hypothetical protein
MGNANELAIALNTTRQRVTESLESVTPANAVI